MEVSTEYSEWQCIRGMLVTMHQTNVTSLFYLFLTLTHPESNLTLTHSESNLKNCRNYSHGMQKSAVTNAICENEAVRRHIQVKVHHHWPLHSTSNLDIHESRRRHSTRPVIGLRVTSTNNDTSLPHAKCTKSFSERDALHGLSATQCLV